MLENVKVLLVGTDPDSNTLRIYTLHDANSVREAAAAVAQEYPGAVPYQIGHFHGRGTEQHPDAFRAAFEPYLSEVPSAGPDWAPDPPVRLASAAPVSDAAATAGPEGGPLAESATAQEDV